MARDGLATLSLADLRDRVTAIADDPKCTDDRVLLSRARNKQGIALVKLGRLTEAILAQAEAWSLAREAANKDFALVAFVRRESSKHDDFDTYLAEGAGAIEYVRVCARMEALIAEGG